MYDIAGESAGAGNPAWHRAQPPAREHSAAVSRVLEAGARVIGKTVCDEFFYSILGINSHYGTPLNPQAPGRIPGGSSSGSASACSAGACDIALGGDTGGSVRVPAALCGVYGIRATSGRMDMRGALKMAPSFDAGGWFAGSAGLLRLAGPVLLRDWVGGEPHPIRRICLVEEGFANANSDVEAICRGFLRAASGTLPKMTAINIANGSLDAWCEAMRVTQAYEVWQSFGDFVSSEKPRLGPGIAERLRAAAAITEADTAGSRRVLAQATRLVTQATRDHTVLALPTTPAIAPELDATPDQLQAFRVNTMRHTCFASIAGLPQITIPIGTVQCAPVGLSFIGWPDGDEALLTFANRVSPFVGCHVEEDPPS
jgi:amidase